MSDDMMDAEKTADLPWEPKCWGDVIHVFNSLSLAVSILRVKAGFRCSRHFHEHRNNRFCLVSGKIEVWEWDDADHVVSSPGVPRAKHVMFPGWSIGIAAGVPHMFKVIEDGMVVEIYDPTPENSVDVSDIVRFDEGGPCD